MLSKEPSNRPSAAEVLALVPCSKDSSVQDLVSENIALKQLVAELQSKL